MTKTSKSYPRSAMRHSKLQKLPIAAGIAVFSSSVMRALSDLCGNRRLSGKREVMG